jgi:hypothetical protein
MRDGVPLLVVPADTIDRSLEDVPGRGAHAYRIPVLPEFLDGDYVQLRVYETGGPVYRGRLEVIRDDEGPRLRRAREDSDPKRRPIGAGAAGASSTRNEPAPKRWWNRR